MLTNVHHIAIICSNYQESLAFYQKIGFSIQQDVQRADRQDRLTMLVSGDVSLELFTRPDAPPRPTMPEARGLRHLAFRVENVESAAAWLQDLGIPTEPIREDPIFGGRMTFFRDPDGLPLELHE